MNRALYGAIGAAAAAAAWLWPLTPALPAMDARTARAAAVVLSLIACGAAAALARATGVRASRWVAVAVLAATAGTALLAVHFSAAGSCVAVYESRPVIIGRTLQSYVRPGGTADELLLDAGGRPERAWTPESIGRCRFLLGWVAVLPIPLFAAAGSCLLSAALGRRVVLRVSAPRPRAAGPPDTPVYDVFFSYRHTEPDRGFALDLLERLERSGLRAAIDDRDFRPNEHFLSEMERCIKQSRFTLCVVTSRYLDSDHCAEEAVISKTLDMAERKRRLVPLVFERVEMPVWLHGIVGVDFTGASATDPLERLRMLLAGA